MTDFEFDDRPSREHCRAVAGRLLAQHNWKLLSPDELAQWMMALLESGEVVETWPAAVHAYCLCLHAACFGGEGRRQDQAFEELRSYLRALSYRERADLPPDIRDEVVNEALARIWQRRDQCRKPGAFLVFAALELRGALRPWWTRRVPIERIEEAGDLVDTREDDDPLAQAIETDLRGRVLACFEASLRRHPRARQQLEAVWLKFVCGLDDATIGAYLAKSASNVHVLRARGLRLLRDDPAWRHLASDLGVSG
jgi:DNA-directed RNA polymerase specialized sigma24 family protein